MRAIFSESAKEKVTSTSVYIGYPYVEGETIEKCPQQESDPHLLLRTELFYPLNYRGEVRK